VAESKYGFEDIVDQQQGIFQDGSATIAAESAMTEFSKAKPHPAAEGMVYEVMCENCGPRKIAVEWPEFVAIRQGISPHVAYQGQPVLRGPATPWGFDQTHQAWFPDIRCSSCQFQFRMMVTPSEIEQALGYATRRGWIALQAVQQLAQLCMAMKQRTGMR